VFVTAPGRRATDVLFRHAADHWPAQAEASAPVFLAPDAPQNKGVFAGTVHGYEGAGRGVATRFRQLLESLPHHSPLFTLEQPLRWPPGDPLEAALNRLLMLDATHTARCGARTCRWLDRDQLLEHEPYLRAVYALLSEAHYRTRPLDLRHLLDGPNLRVAVIDCGGQPVAAALIADEGQFADRELVTAIADGTRRPRGHLMPQLLTWQYSLEHACTQRWWRVVRIAVDSTQRREGLGAHLLTWLQEQALVDQVDAVCTSFGADNAVLSFWEASGYQAAYLGHVREATSGAFSVAMVRSLTPRNRDLMALARVAFAIALHKRTPDDPTLEARLHPRDCPREH